MKFTYEARTNTGALQSGSIEAPDRETALGILQGKKLLALTLEEDRGGVKFTSEITFLSRIKTVDIVLFSRQLAVLIDAQVPLLSALRSLGEQTSNPKFRRLVFDVAEEVNAGTALSQALAKYPKQFSHFFVSVVRAGEASGRLQEVLSYLADHEEKAYDLTRKVRGALIYPIFIICSLVLVGALMMIFVVPQLTAIFEETGVELPFLTKLVIGISNVLQSYWWLALLLFIGAGVGLVRFVRTPYGRRVWDTLLLNTPVFKKLFRKVYLARFSENLSTLIRGGIPIIQALEITGDVVGNTVYKETIAQAAKEVEKGGKISQVLKQNHYVPALVVQMVSVGEDTGQLDMILSKVASFYQRDVDDLVENLTTLIQPVLILILGAAAGVLVAAILLPIYNLGSGF